MGKDEVSVLVSPEVWGVVLLFLCAGAALFLLVCKVIGAVRELRRPKETQQDAQEQKRRECDRKFENDNRMLMRHDREIETLRTGMQVLCEGQLAIVEHALHNGNADQLREACTNLNKYLASQI
jgi:hypothetical protein